MPRKADIPRDPLERAEMVLILEDLARTGGDSARIQAIKTLLVIRREDERVESDGFDDLESADELAERRRAS